MPSFIKEQASPCAILFLSFLILQKASADKPFCNYYDEKKPYDACFGECKLYNPKWEQNFFEHCGQDIDRNGVLAEDACEECGKCVEDKKNTAGQEVYIGGCKPPDEATKACNMEPWFHTYGGCETYRLDHEDSNFPYCAEDKGENGVTAEDACPECGLCYSVPTASPGPGASKPHLSANGSSTAGDTPTTPKPVAPVPSPTLDPNKPVCKFYDKKNPFDACFGGCKLYNPKWKDNLYALCNQDIDRNGVMAEDACEECGKCVEDKKNTAGQEVLVGGCTPPDEATKACNMEPWNHVYGGCETYHPEHADENFPYCAEDKNEAGVAAKDACAECGSCYLVPTASPVGDSTPADVAPATPQPGSPVPPPTLDPNKPVCKFYDKKNPFDACFGECKLYNPTYKDNFYSYCGQDIDRNGVFAEDACEECGKCVEDKKNTAGQEVLIGGCKPPDSPEKPCDDKEPWPGSGYGSCETYHPDHESENFFYCLNDIASNGISAADACSQCGVCFESESTSDRARRGERVGAP